MRELLKIVEIVDTLYVMTSYEALRIISNTYVCTRNSEICGNFLNFVYLKNETFSEFEKMCSSLYERTYLINYV